MKSYLQLPATIAFAFALVFSVTSIASAQQAPHQQVEMRDVSSQEIRQVSEAYVEISAIQQEYQAKLGNVQDPEEAQRLQQQANEEMTQVVLDSGMEVDAYNEIMLMAQMNEELRGRILEKIEQLQR
ncbi:hypothetical protein Selin_0384 [Desulfurispirillum indicum S5]|uniref:DUF4168 domain-containing protein n=1 Tax=Desulfurispirillum indicum (strain ATCC BAA-1389 / DSM 22839 / S5) TaxID=653733 RepID=E6W762_DESIS|nr:DUF4168 domain-containing protein [Desulfurispirillum indicum]ADU65140.1 hypothetical protein Selin_0384 [Desulfurispirillum indicum S5]